MFGRIGSLHGAGQHGNRHFGIAPLCNLQNVAQGGSGRTCYNADAFGKKGQGALFCAVEQTLGCKFLFALFDQFEDIARTGFFHALDNDLIASAKRIYRKRTAYAHFHSVAGNKGQRSRLPFKQYRLNGRCFVFERKIDVPRARRAVVRNLSFNGQRRKRGFDKLFKNFGDLRYAENLRFHDCPSPSKSLSVLDNARLVRLQNAGCGVVFRVGAQNLYRARDKKGL